MPATTFTFAAFCKLSFSLCILVSFHCLSVFAVAQKQMRHFKYSLMLTPCKSLLMLWGISAVYEPLDSWSIHPAGVCLIHHASMSDITHKNGTESGNDSLTDLLANGCFFCVAWHTWWFGLLLLLSHILCKAAAQKTTCDWNGMPWIILCQECFYIN